MEIKRQQLMNAPGLKPLTGDQAVSSHDIGNEGFDLGTAAELKAALASFRKDLEKESGAKGVMNFGMLSKAHDTRA